MGGPDTAPAVLNQTPFYRMVLPISFGNVMKSSYAA